MKYRKEVMLTKETIKSLEKLAKNQNRSVKNLMEHAVVSYLLQQSINPHIK